MPSLETMTVERAAEVLLAHGIVALPTETVYGLGANAFDPIAVARIFAAKERPFFDPLIVHVAEIDWLPRVVSDFPVLARKLAERFWPGPLTLVLPKHESIPDLVTSGLPNVGVRLPDHDLMRQVLRRANVPVAAPSANPFGKLSPTTADHVRQQLAGRIDGILDGGPCRVGIESTIVQIEGEQATLLRPGGIAVEDIEQVTGPVRYPATTVLEAPEAPGMLASHYAPRTPLIMTDQIPERPKWDRTGLLILSRDRSTPVLGTTASLSAMNAYADSILARYAAVEELSPGSDLIEATAGFFQALHRLDAAHLDGIMAVRFPEFGLGRALNDRLSRAAHGTFPG